MLILAEQTPQDEPIRASAVLRLQNLGLRSGPIIAVLETAGLLHDDRVPAVIAWIERMTAGLPSTMIDELGIWFDVLHNGSNTPPRSRPRSPITIRLRLYWALPTLQAWAEAGHTSLREITRADVLAALPPSGNPRATTGHGLRSIFKTLRQHKAIFTNPTARIPVGNVERREPLPIDVDTLRDLLNDPDPACAAIAALLVYHGLKPFELRQLRLIDVRDGRIHLDARTIPLAPPARDRVGRWLDHRQARWPATLNPYVFIGIQNAGGTNPVGPLFAHRALGGISPRALRTDRILDEVTATGGDIRRLTDLFGITTNAAVRYARILDPDDPNL